VGFGFFGSPPGREFASIGGSNLPPMFLWGQDQAGRTFLLGFGFFGISLIWSL
jgi:hypothetical protein